MAHSLLAQMLGVYVVEERKKKHINQAQLAKQLGCTPQFLGRFEKGDVMLPDRLLARCVSTLDLRHERLRKIYRLSAEKIVDDLFEQVSSKTTRKSARA